MPLHYNSLVEALRGHAEKMCSPEVKPEVRAILWDAVVVMRDAADQIEKRSPGPNRAENEIRADECRQIMVALDRYGPASDYGPPITERIALHERGATAREGKSE